MLTSNDGYSRRGNFGGSFVCNKVLIYSPDGTNYGSRGGSLREGLCTVGVESCKIVHSERHFLFTCLDTFALRCIV